MAHSKEQSKQKELRPEENQVPDLFDKYLKKKLLKDAQRTKFRKMMYKQNGNFSKDVRNVTGNQL